MRDLRSSVCLLKKPGGGENTHSVFEGVFLCLCAFQVQTEKSGREGG